MGRLLSRDDRQLVSDVLVQVRRRLGPVEPDGWLPPVQGAVGVVVGLARPGRPTDQSTRWVLKIYRGPDARHRQRNEKQALDLLVPRPSIPAPLMVEAGNDPSGPAWLVMTRRPGRRWADRRPAASESENRTIVDRMGTVLARLHEGTGVAFGALDRPGSADALDPALRRLTDSRALPPASAEDDRLGSRVAGFVRDRAVALRKGVTPAFCHGDFNGGNVLVDDHDLITGVVDFERARWGDPLGDLALTRIHVAHHFPWLVPALDHAYWSGRTPSEAERTRLDVFELLQVFHEYRWVAADRPAGWAQARDRLRAGLEHRLAAG